MSSPFVCVLRDDDATRRLAQALAPCVGPGDVLLLEGPVGAGKTAFARALIQSILSDKGLAEEDVPSPTFTLVQTYDTPDFEIWHADLYRLTAPEEVLELGLEAAFEAGVCLIEWPDRLGQDVPQGAARLTFDVCREGGRVLRLDATELGQRIAGLAAHLPVQPGGTA